MLHSVWPVWLGSGEGESQALIPWNLIAVGSGQSQSQTQSVTQSPKPFEDLDADAVVIPRLQLVLDGTSIAEMRRLAKERSIPGYSTMSKLQLKQALLGNE